MRDADARLDGKTQHGNDQPKHEHELLVFGCLLVVDAGGGFSGRVTAESR